MTSTEIELPIPGPSSSPPPRQLTQKEKEEEEEHYKVWDSFVEQYHDIVVELPLEYQRNFLLLSELEDSQQQTTSTLHSSLLTYISHLQSISSSAQSPSHATVDSTAGGYEGPSETVKTMLGEISRNVREVCRLGEDKVGVAVALYESVDRQIRILDSSLAQIEDSLIIGLRAGTLPSHDAPSLSLKSPPGATTSRGAIALGEKEAWALEGEEDGRGGRRRGRASGMGTGDKKRAGTGLGEGVVGMAVDPNEPRYCYCDRVSFGEMIACENDNCPREWFHLPCVGMEVPPEGKWWCNECRESLGIKAKDEGEAPEKKKRKKSKW